MALLGVLCNRVVSSISFQRSAPVLGTGLLGHACVVSQLSALSQLTAISQLTAVAQLTQLVLAPRPARGRPPKGLLASLSSEPAIRHLLLWGLSEVEGCRV